MPRRGENIYHRKDGRWEGRLVAGKSLDGKTLYSYFYGHSYTEVKRRLATTLLLREKEGAELSKISVYEDSTVAKWLSYWLEEENRPYIKPSTYGVYRRQIERHILPALGALPLRKVDGAALAQLKGSLLQKGLSYRTTQEITKRFLAALRLACEKKLIPSVPASPFDRRRDVKGAGRGRPRFLSLSEQLQLERQLDTGRKGDLAVLVSLYTGLRVGEISALIWRDLDLKGGSLKVSHTLQRVPTFGEDGSGKKNGPPIHPPQK